MTTISMYGASKPVLRQMLESVPASRIDGSEGRAIQIPARNRDPLQFDGESYLEHFALPNFYFHLTIADALLRQAGVDLGKADFLRGGR